MHENGTGHMGNTWGTMAHNGAPKPSRSNDAHMRKTQIQYISIYFAYSQRCLALEYYGRSAWQP